MTPENAVPLPDSIKAHISTSLAWDNIDRLEETLSGGGTSHRVNGIAIQARHLGPDLPPAQATPVITKSKQRSLEVVNECDLPIYMQESAVVPLQDPMLKFPEQRYKEMLGRRISCGFLFGSMLPKSRRFVCGQG